MAHLPIAAMHSHFHGFSGHGGGLGFIVIAIIVFALVIALNRE